LGVFKIIGQSSIASGIRRIEAVAGMAALHYINHRLAIVSNVADRLKTNVDAIGDVLDQWMAKHKAHRTDAGHDVSLRSESVGAVTMWFGHGDTWTPKEAKTAVKKAISSGKKGVFVVTCAGKAGLSCVVAVDTTLESTCPAHMVMKAMLAAGTSSTGAGGGNASMAAGSHPEWNSHDAVVATAKKALATVMAP
jgi:alanyl-tRNA synthetase